MKKIFTLTVALGVLLLIPDISNAQFKKRSYNDQLRSGIRRGEISREEARELKRDRRNVDKVHKIASKQSGLSRKERANLRRERRMTATNGFKSKKNINMERYNRRHNARLNKYSSGNRRTKGLGW